MAALTVWRFDTTDAAERSLAALHAPAAGTADSPHLDAAVVMWPAGAAKPRTRVLEPPVPRPGALGADFWLLLSGLVFSLPLLGAALGTPTGAGAASLAELGIGELFVNRLRDLVTPGSSALLLVAADTVAERLQDALADGPAGDLIRIPLSAQLEAGLRAVFGE